MIADSKEALEVWPRADPTDWITDYTNGDRGLVGSAVPASFEAYARVFHPAHYDEGTGRERVRWAGIAAANGHEMDAGVEWDAISVASGQGTGAQQMWNEEPAEGSFPHEGVLELATQLSSHTATPDLAWFCAWVGWGPLRWRDPGGAVAPLVAVNRTRRRTMRRLLNRFQPQRGQGYLPTVRLANRDYVLLRGSVAAATESVTTSPTWRSASLWWPDDRSWFVATLIDNRSTYVGGSRGCVEEVLGLPHVEALRVLDE